MRITIQLPCPKYLIKFLEFKYGQEYAATENDWFGLLVLNTLSRKTERDYAMKKYNENTYYCITLGLTKANLRGYFLTNRHGQQLAKAIDNYFRKEIYNAAIINQSNFGIEYQTTIKTYLEQYNISEEELAYDSLRKDFNRNKAHLEKNILK